MDLLGDQWTLLVLRDAYHGVRRFDRFQASLGIARNTLTERLDRLTGAGLLDRVRYQDRPPRYEYRLTDRGRDLWPALFGLLRWGDKHAAPDGPPRLIVHRDCGGQVDDHMICKKCRRPLTGREILARPGPGLKTASLVAVDGGTGA